jgi:hypothetical protein
MPFPIVLMLVLSFLAGVGAGYHVCLWLHGLKE